MKGGLDFAVVLDRGEGVPGFLAAGVAGIFTPGLEQEMIGGPDEPIEDLLDVVVYDRDGSIELHVRPSKDV